MGLLLLRERDTRLIKKIGFSKVQILKNVLNDNNFTSSSEMFIIAVK